MFSNPLLQRFFESDRIALSASIVAAIVISTINFMIDRDFAHTAMYVTLLLMSASVVSIRVVALASLSSFVIISGNFLVIAGYDHPHEIAAYIRCIISLVTVTLLTIRSKRLANNLRRNEVFLKGAQRLSRTGSIGLRFNKARCEKVDWSEETYRIYDYAVGIPPSWESMTARVHADDAPLIERLFAQLASGADRADLEHRLVMADGAIKHVHMVVNALHRGCDQFEYVAALMDVSSAKQAEETLFQTQAQLAHVTRVTALGELASSIAHEVNQPLAAIIASGESCKRWIKCDQPDLHEALQSLDRIILCSLRANDVIKGIRALSRKCDPQRQCQRFDEVVSDALMLVQHEMSHRKIRYQLALEAAGVAVSADRIQLQQVIINLIINACQAMAQVAEDARMLQVRTWVQGQEVVLEVRDSGTGIEETLLSSLFNPFFTTKDEGLGMGLSICRSIIEFHGGRIWATRNACQGAAFLFAIPMLEQQQVA